MKKIKSFLAIIFLLAWSVHSHAASPTITSTPVLSASLGDLYSYDVEATDPDAGDTLTYSLDAALQG